MVDFLFVYQHKAREIETVCLLKLELERRGYSCDLLCTYIPNRLLHHYHKARVIVASALYDNDSLWFFVYDIVGYTRKVVNLQSEQVLSNQDEEDINCFHNPKGYAREAIHLCWGEASQKRIIRGGIAKSNAVLTGAVHMDYLLKQFEPYYYTRIELADIFKLDFNAKWCLFISSFTMHNMTEDELSDLIKAYGDEVLEMKKITAKTKAIVLEWLECALKADPKTVIIYRPHPDETSDGALFALAKAYKNFKIIGEYSIKQWIRISDKIFTWYSTSAAEVQRLGKCFGILRPVPIPEKYDVSFYRGAKFIENKKDFISSFLTGDLKKPLDDNLLSKYYLLDTEYPSYMKTCDILENCLHDKSKKMKNHPFFFTVMVILFKKLLAKSIRITLVKLFGKKSIKLPVIGSSIKYMIATDARLERDLSKNLASNKDLDDIYRKLMPIVISNNFYMNKKR